MLTAEQNQVLARAMRGDSGTTRAVDAGYTYFGQFIVHDIVPRTTPVAGERVVSPYLNLESLYGSPGASSLNSKGCFYTCRVGRGCDVLRREGKPLIPEARNDDNVLVLQLHVFWQRFHNFIVREFTRGDAVKARRWLTLLFQMIVVDDYLRQLIAPAVHDSYFQHGERWLDFDHTRIPLEFSHAAFRFGHSMVRPFYEFLYPKPHDVEVIELFRPHRRLSPDLAVDWTALFGWPGFDNGVQDMQMIDPLITPGMASIIVPGSPNVDIVEKNLRSCELADLPPGRTYVETVLQGPNGAALQSRFGLEPLTTLWPGLDLHDRPDINITNLPMWPYILNEAAVAPGYGQRLGTMGSLICAEVLANSIAHADTTICGGNRTWPYSMDNTLSEMGRLGELIRGQQRRSLDRNGGDDDGRKLYMRHLVELLGDYY